jgi:cytochrome b involved in lipid metabolism
MHKFPIIPVVVGGVLLGAVGVGLVYLGKPAGKPEPSAVQPTAESRTPKADATYTMAEVEKHAVKSDCWSVMDGKVYNLTDAFATHPGGDAMALGCGKDATSVFNARPGSGQPHSARAKTARERYLIGTLAN